MRPLTLAEIRPPAAYEPVRAEARRRVIELKRDRRVPLGELLSVVFENRDTIRSVIEELLRAERIDDPERIEEEIAVFNPLVPAEGDLSATLFVEITDQAEMTARLEQLQGIEEAVSLVIGDESIPTAHEGGGSRHGRTASVHYLRFELSPAQRQAFIEGAEVVLVVDHPAYRARTALTEQQRAALSADLTAG